MLIWKLLGLAILFASVILHEIAHGYAALYFGDDTAKRAGRLTLDPMAHVDIFGTIILPVICVLTGAPIFGWAKPVPVDFESLPGRKAELWVTLAGILVNFSLAVLAGLGLRAIIMSGIINSWPAVYSIFLMVMYINLMLAIFNLMPIPPLDGWRIWGVWLSYEMRMRIEMNAMLAMIILFMSLPFLMNMLVSPIMRILVRILAGIEV